MAGVATGAGNFVFAALIGFQWPSMGWERDFGPFKTFALAQAGVAQTTTANLFTTAFGGVASYGPKKVSNLAFVVSADMEKTSGNVSYVNLSGGIVVKFGNVLP